MATTVDLNNITEYNETPSELDAKVHQLSKLIQAAKYPILFTGAGISTSANIPDFRGPNGVWTRQAQGVAGPDCIPLVQAIPTETHKLIDELVKTECVKYIVSQNIDGLHRRSGVAKDKISELHGNTFLSVCWNCDADREQPTEVQGGKNPPKTCRECHPKVPHFCHCTGVECAACGGNMKDSIIHFGENLPTVALERAYANAERCDLCIVLGSSLTVSPANEIPQIVKRRGGKLVIVNLQKTDLDRKADIRIFAKTDEVSAMLKQRLAPQVSCPPPAAATVDEDDEVASVPETIAARTYYVPPASSHGAIVGNRAYPAADNHTDWEIFVQTSSHPIASITYGLHPTFSPNVVTVTPTPANPTCMLRRSGWGTFPVTCEVTFTDGSRTAVEHELNFAPGIHTTASQ